AGVHVVRSEFGLAVEELRALGERKGRPVEERDAPHRGLEHAAELGVVVEEGRGVCGFDQRRRVEVAVTESVEEADPARIDVWRGQVFSSETTVGQDQIVSWAEIV